MMWIPPELTDADDINGARLALDRCSTDADYAAWARQWGASAVAGLREFHSLTRWNEEEDGFS